jgi:hypothetical protein
VRATTVQVAAVAAAVVVVAVAAAVVVAVGGKRATKRSGRVMIDDQTRWPRRFWGVIRIEEEVVVVMVMVCGHNQCIQFVSEFNTHCWDRGVLLRG